MDIGQLTAIASHPILGNLSKNLQERIGENWENFDPVAATSNSIFCNLGIYLSTGAFSGSSSLFVGSILVGGFESVVRWKYSGTGCNDCSEDLCEEPSPVASLIGKLASYPIEYLGGYAK
ncbi:hypothetical protein ISS07_03870 [Candidatus Woesearchaeota archaeon]|nr:hypothetical protein [Candidatus Woesearchaeota archaeon]